MLHKFRAAGLVSVTVAMLMALALLLGLGTWQWQRKAWKESVIATIAARSKAEPVDAATWLGRVCGFIWKDGIERSCEYLAVRLTGTFDHSAERHVYTGIAKPAGGGVGGQGYWIVTPFKLAGSSEVLAVSRGFVPEALKEPGTRNSGQIAGATTIVALVREGETRATFTAANDPAKNMWYLRNPQELFAAGGVTRAGHFVELLSPAPPGGLPQPTAGRIDIPNRHLEYALTWWGLGLTLLGVYAAFVRERLKTARAA